MPALTRTFQLIDGVPVVPGSKFALRPGKYRHGTRSAYVAGCCCQDCTTAASAYIKERRHQALGRPVRGWKKA